MKLNNKGFTLIELLVIIVLLAIIGGISFTVVIGVLDKAREKSYKTTINNIESTATEFIQEYSNDYSFYSISDSSTEEFACIKVSDLIEKGYFDKDILSSEYQKDTKVSNDIKIYITKNKNTKVITGSKFNAGSECYAKVENLGCTISGLDGYHENQTLTINPTDNKGVISEDIVTYSWDGTNYSENNEKSINSTGTHTAYVKDASGTVNSCSVEIISRKEYQSASCTRKWSSWEYRSTIVKTCSEENKTACTEYENMKNMTKTAVENSSGSVYYTCEVLNSSVYHTNFSCKKYTRGCSPINCGTFSDWTTTKTSSSCTKKVNERYTYSIK